MDEDDCEPCTEAAAISVANAICKELKRRNARCKDFFDAVVAGRETVRGYLDRIMGLSRGTLYEEAMDEVLKLYREKVKSV